LDKRNDPEGSNLNSPHKSSLNVLRKHIWVNLGAFFTVLNASGIGIPSSGWSLDPSWIWTMTNATREMLFQSKSFIWTYGPLGFLDFAPNDWKIGFLIATAYAVISTLALYFATYTLLIFKKLSAVNSALISVLLTTYVSLIVAPSLRWVFAASAILIMHLSKGKPRVSYKEVNLLALIAATLFYLKMFPFIAFLILSIGIVFQNFSKNSLYRTLLYLLLLVSNIVLLALLLGFNFPNFIYWVAGYLEMSRGYKAMNYEEVGRLWEYGAALIFFLIISWALLKQRIQTVSMIILIACSYFFFLYGFVRHDGHSNTTFAWLIYIALILTLGNNLRFSGVVLSIAVIASPISVSQLIDFEDRIQRGPIQILKSLDYRYLNSRLQDDKLSLQRAAQLPVKILDQVRNNSVAILPWDQLIAKAYQLNHVTLPVPQPYAAYTEKLDLINADFIKKSDNLDFILLNSPAAIDGRNPLWESPNSNIAILCNYRPAIFDGNYLLLERIEVSRCDHSGPRKKLEELVKTSQHLETIRIDIQKGFIDSFLSVVFKSFEFPTIEVNDRVWRIVVEHESNLILNVPESLDYPGPWKIGKSNRITSPDTNYMNEFLMVGP
jgi:hypothetical protein